MYDMSPYLVAIPGLPLLASILIACLGPRWLRFQSHWLCILAALGSCVLSLLVLNQVAQSHEHGLLGMTTRASVCLESYFNWIPAGSQADPGMVLIEFRLQADSLTAIMLTAITFIGSLIAIYSVGYMHGEEGYPRFFAVFSLFLFSMTGLVLAENFVLLYAFWEGVGLCSYLLIGFWFNKPSAAAAARKAFLVTRLGDIGLFIGIMLVWVTFDHQLSYRYVFAHAGPDDTGLLTTMCLLLFCGAVGKSAQFPLHVWLPDAMEGPTPVSALIHAATMVTAGVYLVARCTPLFVWTPTAQLVVACIGAFTALLAGLTALTQNDLKRVLAYSTVSQLGYMFLALGSGTALTGNDSHAQALLMLAVTAGIFHLFTHAFFKALLFLAAGSVMHAMGGVIDMRRFSGLRKVMPITHWTFLCGAGALAAFPGFSGFWSKDMILAAVYGASEERHPHHTIYMVLLIVALVTAALTAFYTFRAYFMTFWGEVRIPHEAGHHAHESPRVMTVPLIILAVGAVLVGFINAELLTIEGMGHFLAPATEGEHAEPVISKLAGFMLMLIGTAVGLGGIFTAYYMYRLRAGLANRLAAMMQPLYQLSLNKFYFDEIYNYFVVQPVLGLAEFSRIFDLYVVDGLVDIIGQIPRLAGLVFRPIQNGLAQFYALAMALGLTVFIVALVWRYAW
jgi:NADH-quinone oxidoreductase subunit L